MILLDRSYLQIPSDFAGQIHLFNPKIDVAGEENEIVVGKGAMLDGIEDLVGGPTVHTCKDRDDFTEKEDARGKRSLLNSRERRTPSFTELNDVRPWAADSHAFLRIGD